MLGTLSVARVDVALFVLIGLLGGAHCIGMCGPLVTLYASRMRPATDGGASGPSAVTDRSVVGGHGSVEPPRFIAVAFGHVTYLR